MRAAVRVNERVEANLSFSATSLKDIISPVDRLSILIIPENLRGAKRRVSHDLLLATLRYAGKLIQMSRGD
jgi:hypothetical protein